MVPPSYPPPSHGFRAPSVPCGPRQDQSYALLAIDLSRARGEITDGEAVLWTRRRATPYVPSLLLVEDTLYVRLEAAYETDYGDFGVIVDAERSSVHEHDGRLCFDLIVVRGDRSGIEERWQGELDVPR